MNINQFKRHVLDVYQMNRLAKEIVHQDPLLLQQQQGYVDSEIQETQEAIKNSDIVEIMDGIADIFVTASFWACLNLPNEKSIDDAIEQEIKTHLEEMSQSSYFLTQLNQDNIFAHLFYVLHFLDHAVQTQWEDYDKRTHENMMSQVLDEVLRSNLSKFPLIGSLTPEEIQASIEHIQTSKGVKEVLVKERLGRWVFIDASNGKFQKPLCFIEPDLSFVLDFAFADIFK